jgi:hypothetical protein
MRIGLAASFLAASLLTATFAFASPPGAPTPQNPDKLYRPEPRVIPTPKVMRHTAEQARANDHHIAAREKVIPQTLRTAKAIVVDRDSRIMDARTRLRAESSLLAEQADNMENPVVRAESSDYNAHHELIAPAFRGENGWDYKPVTPTTKQLAQASETFVSAAQVLVRKASSFNTRVARENPDEGAKVDAARAMVADFRKGAALYRRSAQVEDRRAEELTKAGKVDEAAVARTKAENTRGVADGYDRKALEIEAKGVPGAKTFTLPTELNLSAK